jgi:predicted permease
MRGLTHDLRITARMLVKSPGYAVASILTLVMAVGANSTIFSAVYAVLLKPTPIHDPSRLVVGWGSEQAHHLPVVELPYRAIEDFSRDAHSLSHVAAVGSTTWPVWLRDRGDIERIASAGVSATFFDTLGARPLLGRALQRDDDLPNAPAVVVISHELWTSRFGGDPSIVGRRLDLDGRLHTVVGVMPRNVDVPRGTQLWVPVVPVLTAGSPGALDNVGVLFVIGRLRRGVTRETARAELESVMIARLAREGDASPGPHVAIVPFVDYSVGPVRQVLWALFGAVGVLLLIGCANVSGLMLARTSVQRRDHAIRLALGATAGDLARAWVVETLLLAFAGGGLGLLAAHWLVHALVALAPSNVPGLGDIAIDTRVAMFTAVLVLATAVLCGFGPVRQAVSTNLAEAVNEAGRATGSQRTRRLRSTVVAAQIGLSIVLLVASSLVVRSFLNLRNLDLGYSPAGVVTMNVSPAHAKPSTSEWFGTLLTRIEGMPQVESAGVISLPPLALGAIGQETRVLLDGQPDTPTTSLENPALNYEVASPGYFSAMKIALKRGRLFDARDDRRSPRVAIVSESTARRLWLREDPIGKRLMIPSVDPAGKTRDWRTIVGVVSDVHYRGLDDVRLDVYDAASQADMEATTLVVRASRNLVVVTSAVQSEIKRVDPRAVVDNLTTMDAAIARVMAPWRFSAWTFTVFALFAFALAIVGLFGVVALDVGQRQPELAIRVAVGARYADLMRCVLVPAAWRVASGTVLGLLVAAAAARAIRSLLFGVPAIDPAAYASVIGVVLVVVTLASYLPARRVGRVDPAKLLTRR